MNSGEPRPMLGIVPDLAMPAGHNFKWVERGK